MRNLQIITICLFLVVALAFSVLFCYDRMMVDHVAPQIICDGVKLEVSVSASDEDLCKGLIATDDVDGDITDRIIVRRVSRLIGANSAMVYYAVFDSASNFCTFTREVHYTDYHQPRFSLSQPMIYHVGQVISLDDRLTAYDAIDGDISTRIRVSSVNISNTTEGEYPLSLQVTNTTGDTAVLSLTVIIKNYTSYHPVIHLADYITYVDLGSEIHVEDFRDQIVSARETVNGASVSVDDIKITGYVDTSDAGCYDVTFSYTNSYDLSYDVILTVIVQ